MRQRDVELAIGISLCKKHCRLDFYAMLQVVPVVTFCQGRRLR